MIQYVIFILLILTLLKTETFNQGYVSGLSNENKDINDEDVKKIPSNIQEYSPKRSFYYISQPIIHVQSLQDILTKISNPNINLIDLEHTHYKPFYNILEINKFIEKEINKLSGPLGVFKILDNTAHIYKGLDVDYIKMTFNLYNISRSAATPVICYLYKTEGKYIIKEIKLNFIKQPQNIVNNTPKKTSNEYNNITYPSSLQNIIDKSIETENEPIKEYKENNVTLLQNNFINKTTDIEGVLTRWYARQ